MAKTKVVSKIGQCFSSCCRICLSMGLTFLRRSTGDIIHWLARGNRVIPLYKGLCGSGKTQVLQTQTFRIEMRSGPKATTVNVFSFRNTEIKIRMDKHVRRTQNFP